MLSFIIKTREDNIMVPIGRETAHQIRREVAQLMRESEFGEVTEIENGKFINTFAIPTIDELIYQNELHITYVWLFPLETNHGDLEALLQHNILGFLDYIDNLDLVCVIKTTLS